MEHSSSFLFVGDLSLLREGVLKSYFFLNSVPTMSLIGLGV